MMTLDSDAKLQIHELLSRAAYAYDERDMDMLEACFAVQMRFTMKIAAGDLVGPFEGREAVMDLMNGSMAQQTDIRRHVISNIFFDPRQSEPTAVSNLTLFSTENGEIQLLSAGVYRDTLVFEDGAWRILIRHIDLDKSY
ncbi:MAG: nuclear transport factor 2 family protein [Halioglobus sp.]